MSNGTHRLGLCMAAAIAGSVIAVPAASADAVKHDTQVTIFRDRSRMFHGDVKSAARKCERGRRVILFKQRPGADRKLGTVRSTEPDRGPHFHNWGIVAPRGSLKRGNRVYAKATRKVGERPPIRGQRERRFVCRPDRSETLTWPWEISPGNFYGPRAS